MKTVKSAILVAMLVALITPAMAGRVWYHSEILASESNGSSYPIEGTTFALGMRSGRTWPVVATKQSGGGSWVGTQTPANWVGGPTNISNGRIRAATSNDGKVAFVDASGKFSMLTKSGWVQSSVGNEYSQIRDIAFNRNNQAVVASPNSGNLTVSTYNGRGWLNSPVTSDPYDNYGVYASACSLAVDSYNQTHVAFMDGGMLNYAIGGNMVSNNWQIAETGINFNANYDLIDMALTSNDIPWVISTRDNSLVYASYDVQTGSWFDGYIDGIANEKVTVATDSKGGIGVAYISDGSSDSGQYLTYAYNDGGGWVVDRIIGAYSQGMLGLDFDFEDNPVIAYRGSHGAMIAYDPVIVPEPASMMILIGGSLLALRKRA